MVSLSVTAFISASVTLIITALDFVGAFGLLEVFVVAVFELSTIPYR